MPVARQVRLRSAENRRIDRQQLFGAQVLHHHVLELVIDGVNRIHFLLGVKFRDLRGDFFGNREVHAARHVQIFAQRTSQPRLRSVSRALLAHHDQLSFSQQCSRGGTSSPAAARWC